MSNSRKTHEILIDDHMDESTKLTSGPYTRITHKTPLCEVFCSQSAFTKIIIVILSPILLILWILYMIIIKPLKNCCGQSSAAITATQTAHIIQLFPSLYYSVWYDQEASRLTRMYLVKTTTGNVVVFNPDPDIDKYSTLLAERSLQNIAGIIMMTIKRDAGVQAWKNQFKRAMVLAPADQISLAQTAVYVSGSIEDTISTFGISYISFPLRFGTDYHWLIPISDSPIGSGCILLCGETIERNLNCCSNICWGCCQQHVPETREEVVLAARSEVTGSHKLKVSSGAQLWDIGILYHYIIIFRSHLSCSHSLTDWVSDHEMTRNAISCDLDDSDVY